MIISGPLASDCSEEGDVSHFWLMRCKHRSVREGVSFQTKSQNPAQNKDATLEVWQPSCNHEDKSQDHRDGRVERSSKSMLIGLSCGSLHGQPTSRLLAVWEKQAPIYAGHCKSGFQWLIAGHLPNDTHTYTYIFCFLRKGKEKSQTLQRYPAHSWLTAGNQLFTVRIHFPLSQNTRFLGHEN